MACGNPYPVYVSKYHDCCAIITLWATHNNNDVKLFLMCLDRKLCPLLCKHKPSWYICLENFCLFVCFLVRRFDKPCFEISNLESSLFLKKVLLATAMLKQPGEHQQMFVLNVWKISKALLCSVHSPSLTTPTLIQKLSTSVKLTEHGYWLTYSVSLSKIFIWKRICILSPSNTLHKLCFQMSNVNLETILLTFKTVLPPSSSFKYGYAQCLSSISVFFKKTLTSYFVKMTDF